MAIKPIDMEQFYQSAGNVYQAIIVTAKRARQIHDDLRIELNQRLETVKALTQVPGETEERTRRYGNVYPPTFVLSAP